MNKNNLKKLSIMQNLQLVTTFRQENKQTMNRVKIFDISA